MEVSFRDNILLIDDNPVSFDFDIGSVITEDDYVFVQLRIPMKNEYRRYARNIYGLKQGKLIWQLEDPYRVYPLVGYTPFEWMGLEDGNLICRDFYGCGFVINKESGKVENKIPSVKW